jgi:dTDP-4-amino-4,6-dideoxygalactose transaminase
VTTLRAAGFDASRAHSLAIVRPLGDEGLLPDNGEDWLSRTVFLPCYRDMSPSEIDRLADVVLTALAARSKKRRHPVAAPVASLPVRVS